MAREMQENDWCTSYFEVSAKACGGANLAALNHLVLINIIHITYKIPLHYSSSTLASFSLGELAHSKDNQGIGEIVSCI